MSYAVVTLKKGEGRTLKAGGAWIFDNEIESITGGFDNGSIVLVHDFDGYPMGRGFINQNSKIRVRMMTRNIHQEIDESFLRMRVKNAWEYRKTIVDTSSCRLIFGEADFLPGLTVDKYEDVLVVECLALGMEAFKETIVKLLKEVLAEDGVIIRGVYERSDANERKKKDFRRSKDGSASRIRRKWRLWKMECIIWWMWKMDRKPDSSWIRSTTVWRCSASARENGCWTALPIWEHLP